MAAEEIVSTEESYVHTLQTLMEVYSTLAVRARHSTDAPLIEIQRAHQGVQAARRNGAQEGVPQCRSALHTALRDTGQNEGTNKGLDLYQ